MNRPEHVRIPPQATEAEQAVIGGLLLAPEAWAKIGDWLTEADFYRRDHQLIYRGVCELAGKGKPYDAVTLGEWFDAQGLAEVIGGPGYLVELASTTPSAANIVAYAEIVQEKSRLRQLIEIGTEAVNDGFNAEGRDAQLLVSEAQRKLTRLNVSTAHVGPQPPAAALTSWYHGLCERFDRDDTITGLVTPWHDLNALTFGLQPGDLIVVAARPNIGKSVMGFQQLAFTGLRGDRCLGFSLEMSYEQVLQRMVSALSEIPHDVLRSPAGHGDEFARMGGPISELKRAAFLVDDQPRLTAEQIVARSKREHLRNPLKLVLVDHLHDMRRPGKDLVNEIGEDCRVLKALAKDLRCPVIVLAQLNRQGGDKPTLKDLRGSGGIEEVADVVLLMHRDDYGKQTAAPSPVEIIVGKGRNMPSGRTIYLENRYDIQRLDDMRGYAPPPEPAPKSRGFAVDGRPRAAGRDS